MIGLTTTLAGATPPATAVELVWEAPAECPGGDYVRGRLVRLLGEDTTHESVRAEGTISSGPDGTYVLRLSLTTPTGIDEREIAAAQCELLGDVAAIVIALAIDPLAADRAAREAFDASEASSSPRLLGDVPEPPRGSATRSVVGPTSTTPALDDPTIGSDRSPASEQKRAAERRRRSRVPRAGVRVLAGGVYGIVPELGAAIAPGIALLWRRVRFDLGATHIFARTKEYADSSVGGRFRATSGSVRGCYVAGPERWEVPLCLGAELGGIRGRGTGVQDPATTWRPWAALLLGGGVAWVPHRNVALVAMVEGHVRLVRKTTFRARELEVLHELAAGGIRLLGGVEARFP